MKFTTSCAHKFIQAIHAMENVTEAEAMTGRKMLQKKGVNANKPGHVQNRFKQMVVTARSDQIARTAAAEGGGSPFGGHQPASSTAGARAGQARPRPRSETPQTLLINAVPNPSHTHTN